jgi:hypothetical protein
VRGSKRHAWWGDLVKIALVCAVFSAAVSAAGVQAAESVASNIDLMQRLTAQVIGELHGKFQGAVAGRGVQLRPGGTTEDYTFVTNVFREELTRLGVTTIEPTATPVPGDSASSLPLILQYQNVIFDLKYVDSHRAHLIGGKRVDRRASVRIMTTLSDPVDGRVVWVGEAARDFTDEIDYADAARLEQGTYVFNHPVVPSGGWGRYAEPVFVTGIIVGLIYLFFSNQSDN